MYKLDGRIRYSEIGSDEKLTPVGLINYFQDCNTFHSEDVGLDFQYYRKLHRAWVLSGWQVVIHRMPSLGEEITVCTWPYDFKRFAGMRNYTLCTRDGERLAEANGVWTLLDTEKKCPVRVTEQDIKGFVLSEKLDMEYAPRRIKPVGDGMKKDAIVIGRERLDTNGHMNNAQYISLAGEFVPETMNIRQIRVEYKKEIKYKSKVIPVVYQDAAVSVVFESEDGEILAIVEFQ